MSPLSITRPQHQERRRGIGRISAVPPERHRRLSLSPRGTSGERAGERRPFIPSMFYRVSPLSSGWWYRQNAPRLTHGHAEQELNVAPGLLELVQHQFHGFDRRHARQRAAEDDDLVVFVRVVE